MCDDATEARNNLAQLEERAPERLGDRKWETESGGEWEKVGVSGDSALGSWILAS